MTADTTPPLPDGTTWRRATPDDAGAIFELVAERNTSVVGFADITMDDIVDELDEPGFDRERDGWLVHGDDGRLLGWGWAFGRSAGPGMHVDVYWRDVEVARWLFGMVLARAAEMAATEATTTPRSTWACTGSTRTSGPSWSSTASRRPPASTACASTTTAPVRSRSCPRASRSGSARATRSSAGPPTPSIRPPSRRTTASPRRSSSAWREAFEASSTHDWAQLQVLLVDGEPAGLLVGNDQFVGDEDCGYVRIVGVLDQYRGRGLARLLLERAFARDAAAGRAGTLLHVDTANTTPALDLYLSVGMRAVLAIDMWHRDLPAAASPARARRGAVGARARSCPTRAGRPACSSGRRPSGDRGPWRWPRRCSTAAAR